MTEGWSLDAPSPNGATGLSAETHSLAVGYDGNKSTATAIATVSITAKLCNGGSVTLGGKNYSASMRFAPNAGSPSVFDVSGSLQYGSGGGTNFHDFFFQNTGTFIDTYTFFGTATTTYLTIYLGITGASPWVGTIYLDDITIR